MGATTEMLGLAGVFMAVTFIVFALYGLLAAQARTHVMSRPTVVRWLTQRLCFRALR
jgi:threonine/homoserine/homoserine lactone efflux protein